MILNGLPWKRTEIILSFLRLHPSTAFRTLCDPMDCSLPGSSGKDVDLDYHDIEWFALEMNGDHSVVFEIAVLCWSSHEEIPHAQGKRNPSKKLALREGIRGQTD